MYLKKMIKLRKNSSFNWFTPFHVLIRPVVIWKKISRPLYHVHFTVIHTNSRHKSLKMLYLRNERADWHGTKGMWVNRMLDSHYDFALWRHPWAWPWIFKINFLNSCISETGGPFNMEGKGYEWIGCYTYYVTLSYDFDLEFWRSNLKKLYHKNKRVDWHGTKRMWVDRMLDPSCDFKLWPHLWTWPLIFKVKFLIAMF